MMKVSIVSSANRFEGVTELLRLIDGEVSIPDRAVMVKPNFVTTRKQLAATQVDATRAILEYLSQKGVSEFVIAVGPAVGTPDSSFDSYGYRALADDFNIEFLDLNSDDRVPVPAFDDQLNPQTLSMIDIEFLGASIEDVLVAYEARDEIAEQLTWPLEGDWRGVFERN